MGEARSPGGATDVMANIKSQIKRNRQTIVRTERNKAVRSELKTRTKSATTAAAEGAENAAGAGPRGAEAHRHGRPQGRDPQERGRPSQVAPGQEAQPEHLRRLTERVRLSAGASPRSAGHRDIVARRATSTSSTRWSGQALPPRRSRSALGEQVDRAHDALVAEAAGLTHGLPGREGGPLHAEQIGGLLLAGDVGAVEAEHPRVVRVQGAEHLEGMAFALPDHALQAARARSPGRPDRWRRSDPTAARHRRRPGTARSRPLRSWRGSRRSSATGR